MAKKELCDGYWKWWTFPIKRRFPTFSVLLLLVGLLWLLTEIKVIAIDIPWWPVIIIVIALWGIIDYLVKE